MGTKLKSAVSKAKPRHGVQFNIRMDADLKERIEHAARASRQSLTEFTEAALMEKADEVLAEHERIALSDRDYQLFVEIMTAETEPTDLAKQEAAEFQAGHHDRVRYRWS